MIKTEYEFYCQTCLKTIYIEDIDTKKDLKEFVKISRALQYGLPDKENSYFEHKNIKCDCGGILESPKTRKGMPLLKQKGQGVMLGERLNPESPRYWKKGKTNAEIGMYYDPYNPKDPY